MVNRTLHVHHVYVKTASKFTYLCQLCVSGMLLHFIILVVFIITLAQFLITLIQRPVIHRRTDKADNFNKRNGSVKLFYISFLTVHLGVDWIEFQCEKQTV